MNTKSLKLEVDNKIEKLVTIHVLIENGYMVWSTNELVEKEGKLEIRAFYIHAEKPGPALKGEADK